jgi:hypothetical protein
MPSKSHAAHIGRVSSHFFFLSRQVQHPFTDLARNASFQHNKPRCHVLESADLLSVFSGIDILPTRPLANRHCASMLSSKWWIIKHVHFLRSVYICQWEFRSLIQAWHKTIHISTLDCQPTVTRNYTMGLNRAIYTDLARPWTQIHIGSL